MCALFAGSAIADDRKPLFQDHEVVKAVLTAPISQTYAQRHSDIRLYFPGQFAYIDAAGEPQRLEVSIRIRRNFRKNYCELPPIRLNFKKKQVEGTVFAGQDKLKLVGPCQHGLKSQQALLLEFMAYRIYEILTDQSFGARLFRLSYVDSDEKLKSWTDLAFVIEDEKDIGKRLGLDKANVAKNQFEDLDQRSTALFELFQLMISNHDYSVLQGPAGEYCCHNAVIYTREEAADKRIPIPYDFDMSGLVDAEYAAPPSHLPIRLVRTRFYRGLCQPPEVLEGALAPGEAASRCPAGAPAGKAARRAPRPAAADVLRMMHDEGVILVEQRRVGTEGRLEQRANALVALVPAENAEPHE